MLSTFRNLKSNWIGLNGPAGAFSLNSLGNAVDPNPLSHTQSYNSSGTLLKLSIGIKPERRWLTWHIGYRGELYKSV
nr:V3 [Grapevine geminivirus A defective DNA]